MSCNYRVTKEMRIATGLCQTLGCPRPARENRSKCQKCLDRQNRANANRPERKGQTT